jgi:ribosomal protein L40E
MKKRNRLRWTLVATEAPAKPGFYFVGKLYYPEHGFKQEVQDIGCVFLQNAKDYELRNIYSDDCVVWYGPIEPPKVQTGTMTRLKREQQKAFVQNNEKHCDKCGAVSGVNKRSMLYIEDAEDCRKCGAKDAVNIREKPKAKPLDITGQVA